MTRIPSIADDSRFAESTGKLRIMSLGIADIEWHGDGRCYAATLQSFAVDGDIGNRDKQEAAIGQQIRAPGQQGTGAARAHHRAESVFLESIRQDLFSAAGTSIDEQNNWLPPLAVDDRFLAAAFCECHGRAVRVENVQIAWFGAAPAVPEIPDEGIGVLERSAGYQLFELLLIRQARVGPNMDISDLQSAYIDDPGTFLHCCAIHFIWPQPLRHHD